MRPDAEAILLDVLASYSDADKWIGSMEKGGSASHKLTKRRGQLRPIHEFEEQAFNLVAAIDQQQTTMALPVRDDHDLRAHGPRRLTGVVIRR